MSDNEQKLVPFLTQVKKIVNPKMPEIVAKNACIKIGQYEYYKELTLSEQHDLSLVAEWFFINVVNHLDYNVNRFQEVIYNDEYIRDKSFAFKQTLLRYSEYMYLMSLGFSRL